MSTGDSGKLDRIVAEAHRAAAKRREAAPEVKQVSETTSVP
jgi:hypothetical protein